MREYIVIPLVSVDSEQIRYMFDHERKIPTDRFHLFVSWIYHAHSQGK